MDFTTAFTTTYGDTGWFASGGGGSTDFYTPGLASIGGGGNGIKDGQNSNVGYSGKKHTGGGGGGGAYSTTTTILGGSGGSGIVLVKQTGFLFP
jgi:hypothetical protein